MKTSIIVAHMGYAEDSYASMLVLRSIQPFDTAVEAVNDLAHCWLIKWIEQWELLEQHERRYSALPSCCVAFRAKNEPGEFWCPKCGRKMDLIPEVLNLEDFGRAIHHHLVCPMDGYGDPLSDFGPWTEFAAMRDVLTTRPDEILDINPYAERVIPLALRGDEFDDPEHRCHVLADALRRGVENYSKTHGWVGHDWESPADLPGLLEKYRVTAEGTSNG